MIFKQKLQAQVRVVKRSNNGEKRDNYITVRTSHVFKTNNDGNILDKYIILLIRACGPARVQLIITKPPNETLVNLELTELNNQLITIAGQCCIV
jgi:hypothetical protein